MRKLTAFLSIVMLFIIAVPLLAQEENVDKEQRAVPAPPPPPQPLNDDWSMWMIGEWEGVAESPMGKANELEKVESSLDGQFLLIQSTSEFNGKVYKGMGAVTIDPKTGEYIGYWFDNMRGIYEGKGTREGDKITMLWKGTQGKSKRIIQKTDDDHHIVIVKAEGPDGKIMESKAKMTRKGKMKEKVK